MFFYERVEIILILKIHFFTYFSQGQLFALKKLMNMVNSRFCNILSRGDSFVFKENSRNLLCAYVAVCCDVGNREPAFNIILDVRLGGIKAEILRFLSVFIGCKLAQSAETEQHNHTFTYRVLYYMLGKRGCVTVFIDYEIDIFQKTCGNNI